MKVDPHSVEYPAHVVGVHSRGLVCPGEVWNQFVDFATAETVREWMAQLTPELRSYFHSLAERGDFAGCRSEKEKSVLRLLIAWYENHRT